MHQSLHASSLHGLHRLHRLRVHAHDHTPEPGPCTNHSAPAHFMAFIAFIAFAFTLTTFMAFIAFIAFADTLTTFIAFIAFIAFAFTLTVFMAFIAFIAFAFTLTAFIAFIARRMPFFIGGASSTAFFIAFAMIKGEREIEGYGHELKNQLEPKWLRSTAHALLHRRRLLH